MQVFAACAIGPYIAKFPGLRQHFRYKAAILGVYHFTEDSR